MLNLRAGKRRIMYPSLRSLLHLINDQEVLLATVFESPIIFKLHKDSP